MKHYALTILLLVVVVAAGGFFLLRDNQAPSLTLTPSVGPISAKRPPLLTLEDEGAGLKNVLVTVTQGDQTIELLRSDYQRGTASPLLDLSLKDVKLKNGPLTLEVTATDQAILANTVSESFSFDYDSRPPVVSVLTRAHNLNQCGAGLVLYKVSEEVERSGVQIGEHFFPGYLQEEGFYACLFAFPYDMQQAAFLPRLIAVDRAGNERKAGFYYHTNPRPPKRDRINLSQQFLDSKMPQFQDLYPEAENMLDIFLRVNRELRQQNRTKLKEFSRQTAASPSWQGTFLRLPNAANRAGFNEQRAYIYGGNKVDQQTHLGIDLASLANSPVPAANSGSVVFADYLGIYGNCVVVDHGLGLQTLYAHLSTISASVGDQVDKGQIIGRTGATGMAGGDHLHYGVVIAGVPVNPVEWWDPNWIKHNFSNKWQAALAPPAAY
ncbi:MAG: peptidase M23 [Desulfuromonadales bacterium C00003094]|nr:MAG: peptidase M23 [Desulfuromonadales bacterium C00003094]